MKTAHALGLTLLLAGLGIGYELWLAPGLPDRIPIHWDLNGRVDGWATREQYLWISAGLLGTPPLLLGVLPWLSPAPFSVESFRRTFNYLMALLGGLFGLLHWVSLQAALNPEMDSGRVLIGGLFVFFAAMGNVLGKVRRNFWIGVRTPWTLASDRVWVATHRLAARLMVAAGLLGAQMISAGAPPAAGFGLLVGALLIPVGYSLVLYRRFESDASA